MEKQISQRAKIRIRLYLTTLFLVLFSGLIINAQKASVLTRQLNAASERSISELEECMSSINTNLTKGLYANTSPMLDAMSVNLIRDAATAKNSLAALPLSDTQLDNILKFLSQVGSFVGTLNKKLSAGESITDEERSELKRLIDISQTLSSELASIAQGIENGDISFSQAGQTLTKDDNELTLFNTAMSDAEQALSDYPTLIYDGPFSDHILTQSPKMLEGKPDITKEEAQKAAAEFIGTDPKLLNYDGEAGGTIEAYIFSQDSISISICKKGGYVLYLLGSSYAGEAVLSAEQAIESAASFLKSKGYDNIKDSYYSTNDGICTINFAYFKDDIIYYPDLIKVSISLETGNVISFDAHGYIMNHTDRTLPDVMITADDARTALSTSLKVMSTRLAVIPTDYKGEKLCYELHCKNNDGDEILVYIDVITAKEDDILLLLYSDNGILTK